jgi:cell wall-associated NlpC family hydrolase
VASLSEWLPSLLACLIVVPRRRQSGVAVVRGRSLFAGAVAVLSSAVLVSGVPASAAPTPTAASLYAKMRAESAALEGLAQRSLENQQRATAVKRENSAAERAYRAALLRRERAADAANDWARTAYMTTPGPSLVDGLTGTGLTGRTAELTRADTAVRAAEHDWQATAAQARTLEVDVAADHNAVAVRSANLRRFRVANSVLLARQQATAAASDMSTYRTRVAAGLVDGSAGPVAATALEAVRIALAQLGKPYVFGAEGPSTYDCSGLVQYAYGHAGIAVPRTARPQYRASRPVPPSQLLPGDLLFFATDKSNWDTIHHVGIYLGGGRMVHAPTTGDVVRIAPVWWAEYFGAGRVVSAGS